MSTNPLAPDPVTNIDGPGVYPPSEPVEHLDAEHLPETDAELDYNEPANGVDDEPGETPEDELPEPDPDEEPLAQEDSGIFGTTKQ